MLLVDGAVAHVVDGDVHEFPTAGTHDDILHTLRKNDIFVLSSFGELLGIPCHSGNHGPEILEIFVMLQSISIETFAARGKMNE